ncbi:MAG: ATP-binding protein, partial [bacterium]
TLLDYLEQNKPDWRHDIGKVIDDQVLLNTQLEPRKREGKSLYGIEINTDKLETTLLSEQYLKEQLNNTLEQRKKLTGELEKIYQNKEEELKKLQKKINKTFRDIKNEEEQKKYLLSQLGIKVENLNNQWKNLKEEADKEKEKAIKNIKDKINEKENSLDQIKKKKKEENEYFQNSVADIEKQKTEQINSSKKQRDKAIKDIKKQVDENYKAAEQEKEKITQNRNKALKEKGIDTNTLSDLESRIKKLQEKLNFIDKNTQTVFEYRKDQKDYLLQMETFKNNKDQLEEKIKKKESRWKEREKEFYEQIDQVKNKKQELEKQKEYHQKQVEWLDQKFRNDSIFQEFKNYIENNDKYEKEDVETLIDKIRQQKNEENEKANTLREQMAAFAGFFDENNTLQLPVMVQTHKDSIQFAEFLKDIEENQKITDMELDVTKKYAMMINIIGKDTDELFKKREEIEKVVSRMNTDFRNSNFVGVVRSIELRLQHGTDPIIHTLRDIQEFRSDNMLTVGENNLFTQDKGNSGNTKAVELLEELDKRISNHKGRYVGIEDAFELEFRIRENENDTGWVSRLSNVGSHGTDILVKSMIYINLLNIFKKRESQNKSNTKIHCLIDEVGILHDTNVRGLINFAAERDIYLINSSPNSHNEEDYKHIYQFNKDRETNKTNVFKLLSQTI